MALTNAGNLGQNQLLKHLIQDGPYNVQFLDVWPWFGVDGKQLEVATTPRFPTPTAQLMDACGKIAENTRNPNNALKQFPIASIQSRYDICNTDADTIEYPNDLYAEQDSLAIQSLMYEYARLLDVGGVGFPALHTLTDNLVEMAGALPQVEDFNRALLHVTTNNGNDVIVMGNLDALNTYWSQCYDRGTSPQFWQQQVPGNLGGSV
ncbi:MAG: hypothetical protein L3J82_05640 [Planctomycetes bacterium]|nr:hypothetical protein [Planctomycetota bacterium]